MKPTRNLVKPNNRLWKTKRAVWYKYNSDKTLGIGKAKKMETEKLRSGKMVGFNETTEYHLEVCDEPISECPIKKAYYKKYGDFGKYPISE